MDITTIEKIESDRAKWIYKELEKNSNRFHKKENKEKAIDLYKWIEGNCGNNKGMFIEGKCENGHHFAKEIVCGKEWCSVCGYSPEGDRSNAHKRKVVRWLPKFRKIRELGYWVITFPIENRKSLRTKESLSDYRKRIQDIFKKYGYENGLSRWHWFGDESNNYNPHLNIAVISGWLDKNIIENIKKEISSIMNIDNQVIEYKTYSTWGQMVHKCFYITRPTFLKADWDIEMAMEIKGFRNSNTWGKWDMDDINNDLVEDFDEDCEDEEDRVIPTSKKLESLVEGKCYCCGKEIKWEGVKYIDKLIIKDDVEEIGAGYWRIDKYKILKEVFINGD